MALAVVAIFLAIALVLLAVVWLRQRARQVRLKFAPELKPESLVDLSLTAATGGGGELADPKVFAVHCAEETELVLGYRCEVLLRDRTISELKDRAFISVDWKVEYARPDKYHVLQSTWGRFGYQYDEWVSVGTELHENVGQWTKMPENTRAEWNEALRADKFFGILRGELPRSADLRRFRGVYYYFLSYEMASLSGFGPFVTVLRGGPYTVQMWIHRATGLLARADVIGASAQSAGDQAYPDFEQVFWNYNEAIEIAPPLAPPQIVIPGSQV